MQGIKHHSIDESIYHHAFKYFSEGLTNQAIKTRLAVSNKVSIKELVEPSLELIIDQIEKIVTKNLSFHKNGDYYSKKKKFMSSMIERRIFQTKADPQEQKELLKKFLKACKHYCKKGTLQEYDCLELEKIFQNMYYSSKNTTRKPRIIDSRSKQTVQHPLATLQKPFTPIFHSIEDSTQHFIHEELDVRGTPALNQSRVFINPQVQIFKELQEKKRMMQSLKLEHEILLKRSEMLQIQTSIKQLEDSIYNANQSNILKNAYDIIKTDSINSNHNHQINRIAIKKEQTKPLILDESIQIDEILIQDQQPQEEQQESEYEQEPPEEVISESPDSEFQYSSRNSRLRKQKGIIKKQYRRKPIHTARNAVKKQQSSMPINRSANASKEQNRTVLISKADVLKQQLKRTPTTPTKIVNVEIKKRGRKRKVKEEIPTSKKQTKDRPESSDRKVQLKPTKQEYHGETVTKREAQKGVSEQDFHSTIWRPDEQKAYIQLLQSHSFKELFKISRDLIKKFGKKERFKQSNLRQKQNYMYNICRQRFFSSLLQRRIMDSDQFKTFEKHFKLINNKVGYVFIRNFLSEFYLTKIQTLQAQTFMEMVDKIEQLYGKVYNRLSKKQVEQSSTSLPIEKNRQDNTQTEVYHEEEFIVVSENDSLQVVELTRDNRPGQYEKTKVQPVELKRQDYGQLQNMAKRNKKQIVNLGITQKMMNDAIKLKNFRQNDAKIDSSYDSAKSLATVEIRKGYLPPRHLIKMQDETNFYLDSYKQMNANQTFSETMGKGGMMRGKNPFAIAFNQFTKRQQ